MRKIDYKQKWEESRQQLETFQRVDPDHPLSFFVGIDEFGRDELLLITVQEPEELKSSKALDIRKNTRKDGKWATQISLEDRENEDIFAKLCSDLVESSFEVTSEKEGLSKATNRFIHWQKLFANLHSDISESVMKGLIGELTFASEKLAAKFQWDKVVDAWQGPDGADRDFILPENWYEIKATSTGKDTVEISSLDQLNAEGGYLVRYAVDRTSSEDPLGFSFFDFIAGIRKKMETDPVAEMKFEQKLINVGYMDKDVYKNSYFTVSDPEFYKVSDNFPRLTPENVPVQIIKARYEISLASIAEWRVNSELL